MEEEKLLKILEGSYDIKFDKIELLREGGCITYIVKSEANKFLVKVIPMAFMNTAKHSLDILVYLQSREFTIPEIIFAKDGLPYVETNEFSLNSIITLFKFIEGREPEVGEDIETIGRLVGQLHSIMKEYKGQLPALGKEFFIDRYINILKTMNYDESKIKIFRKYGDFFWDRVKNLPRGFSHGDLYRGNLLKSTTNNYYILDFDTSCYGFPIYDIMVMCNSTHYFDFDEKGYENSKAVYESFLIGYTKYCTLSEDEYNAFYDLIAVYHYQLQATIIEIHGPECVDEEFLDKQLDWLIRWRKQIYG